MVQPAERVLQRQEPQGVFFTSVELKHLKYKCLLAKQRASLSSADRCWGVQPAGPCGEMFCWTRMGLRMRKQPVFQPRLDNRNQKGAVRFSLRLEDVSRTGRVFSKFCQRHSSKLMLGMFIVSEGGLLAVLRQFPPRCAGNNRTYLLCLDAPRFAQCCRCTKHGIIDHPE